GIVRVLFVTVIVLVPIQIGFAQTASSGALTGTTSDPTPAVIPGVQITITNEATRETRSSISNESGLDSFPQLAPGSYPVEPMMPGLKSVAASGVRIGFTKRPRLDLQLEVGALSETISVEAAPVMVQQESSALGRVVGEAVVTNLPLVSRNFTQILALSP